MFNRHIPIVDFFLPKTQVDAGVLTRIRVFTTMISIVIIYLVYVEANFSIRVGLSWMELIPIHALIAFSVISLCLIRKGWDYEWIAVAYYSLYLLIIVAATVLAPLTILSPSFQALPIMLVYTFLLVLKPKKRLVFTTAIVLACCIMVLYVPLLSVKEIGIFKLEIAHKEAAEGVVLRHCFLILNLGIYVFLKLRTEKELKLTIEKRLDDTRIAEITDSLQSIFSHYQEPLKVIDAHLDALTAGEGDGKGNLDAIEKSIRSIIKTSHNIGWVYKAYRSETVSRISVETFADELGFLLGGRFPDLDFPLVVSPDAKDLRLGGPMPELMLLVLTVVAHIRSSRSGNESGEGSTRLELSIKGHAHSLALLLSWNKAHHSFSTQDFALKAEGTGSTDIDFRRELIADLVASSGALLSFGELNDRSFVEIAGDWSVMPSLARSSG